MLTSGDIKSTCGRRLTLDQCICLKKCEFSARKRLSCHLDTAKWSRDIAAHQGISAHQSDFKRTWLFDLAKNISTLSSPFVKIVFVFSCLGQYGGFSKKLKFLVAGAGHRKQFWVTLRWAKMCGCRWARAGGALELKKALSTNSWLPGSDMWVLDPVCSSTPVTWNPTYCVGYLWSLTLWLFFFALPEKACACSLSPLWTHSLNTSRLWDSAPGLPGLGSNRLQTAAPTVCVFELHLHQWQLFKEGWEWGKWIFKEQILLTCSAVCLGLGWLQS